MLFAFLVMLAQSSYYKLNLMDFEKLFYQLVTIVIPVPNLICSNIADLLYKGDCQQVVQTISALACEVVEKDHNNKKIKFRK